MGFTLIELSIVLVIIGLIVGGILVGQDLIKGAEVRAQISQIEKYNQAVNTFKAKFGGLPGDLALSAANQYGFAGANCDGSSGKRDGDGLLEGWALSCCPLDQGVGETALFWQDISSAASGNLIEGQFPNSGGSALSCSGGGVDPLSITPGTSYVGDYFPLGRIGHGTFVYVYEASGYNWYGLSSVTDVQNTGTLDSNTKIPVIQAYNIDNKIDDGLPTTGVVQAMYLGNGFHYAPSAASDSTATCYNTTSGAYSLSTYANYGAGGNCALSFRFQ